MSAPRLEPWDEHNQRLVQAVHPADWKNPAPKPCYDLVVIGAGTAGLVCAAGAAGLGARVALVERHLMGGDCLNFGCVPSKSLLHAAALRDAPFPEVMERLRKVRADISRHDSAERFASLGVDVFLGAARFRDERTVEVAGAALRFKKAVIATGARAFVPELPGLREATFYTNETIFSLTELPARLLVIGAGPIGAELSQAFQRLGSTVTLVERGNEILPREDPEAGAVVRGALERDGVRVLLQRVIERVERGEAIAQGAKGAERLPFDAILLGAGRAPNVEGLGLEAARVQYDTKRGVHVDDFLRTANARIFACGDVCMEKKFTHAADFAARAVIQNALFFGRKRLSAITIPHCTYTSPELAHVGMDARAAERRGTAIDTYTVPMGGVDRAILEEQTEGFFRVHVRKGTDKILGATLVSAHAGESLQAVVLAMNNGIGLAKIGTAICPYPTQADAIRKAGDLYSRTRLTPRAARLLKFLIGMNR